MVKRVWKVVHPLLTLAAVGCCVYLLLRPTSSPTPDRANEELDEAVRAFVHLRWIGGEYELPHGERFAVVTLMEFKDGEFKRTYFQRVWDATVDGQRVRTRLVWGEGPTGKKALLIDGGTTGYDGDFAELGGPLGRIYGAARCDEVRGFRAIGFASSKDVRPGHEQVEEIGGLTCSETVESRKRVLVLGVKPFPDKATAEQCVADLYAEPCRK
ncbi:MAG: hypothetical protein ACOVT5_10610 [Armatimonadaceae bacterium]